MAVPAAVTRETGRGVSVIIPFKPDGGQRDRAFAWVEQWWRATLPDAEVVVETSHDEPMCRAAVRNAGVARARGDVLVLADADTVAETGPLATAIGMVRAGSGAVLPFDSYELLSEDATAGVLATDPASGEPLPTDGVEEIVTTARSGVIVLSRRSWDAVRGQDDRFVGWGWEDNAFALSLDELDEPMRTLPGRAVHLHHPRSLDTTFENPLADRSRRILEQYHRAVGDRRRMQRLRDDSWVLPGRGINPAHGLAGAAYAPSLRICLVLYQNTVDEVRRCVRSIGAAVRYAQLLDRLGVVEVMLGDCSPQRVLSLDQAEELARTARAAGVSFVQYDLFGENLGSAGGNQRLAEGAATDLLLMLNPDTTAAPNLLVELLLPLGDPTVGITEARQMPFSHPKPADPRTGDTSWASGCCLMIRRDVFVAVGGYEPEHFPLYYDDVDLSWRVRLAGWRIVHAARAALFHDKRHDGGALVVEAAEHRSSSFAQLLLAHRYGRTDVLRDLFAVMRDGSREQRDAVAEFERRRAAGTLPAVRTEPEVAEIAVYDGFVAGGLRNRAVAR